MTSSDNNLSPANLAPLWRGLDANLNRCLEGLRVLEDVQRFGCDQAPAVEHLKQMRHELIALFPKDWLSAMAQLRDVEHDVGKPMRGSGEYERSGIDEILAANFSRCQQSLRVLEELSKAIDPRVAEGVERLRYRAYSLEQLAVWGRAAEAALSQARLYVLVDGRSSREDFRVWCRDLVAAGPDVIQLRDKRLDDRELAQRAEDLVELTRGSSILAIVNDRADIAVCSRADGVHVGQDELDPRQVRRIIGPDRLIGVSTHELSQARQAEAQGAHYLGAGPTFASRTKSFGEYPGLDYLKQVAAVASRPVFAIGGIEPANLDLVLETGIRRVAVSACVTQAADPAAVVAELKSRLEESAGDAS